MKSREERQRIKNERKNNDDYVSWKQMWNFYKKIRIPWALVIITAVLSFAVKKMEVLLVPYQTKIMTGAIADHGFLGGFVFFTLAYAAVEAIQGYFGEISNYKTTRNVRNSVWDKMLNLSMSYYDKTDSQRLVSRITQDTTSAYNAISALVMLFSIIYGVYISFEKMYATYSSLALIMLSGIPLLFLSAWIVGKMQYKIIYITNTAISVITNYFAERLPNIFNIKTSNMEDEEYQAGIKANDDRYRAVIRQEKIFAFMEPIGSLAQYVNEIVLLLVATALVRAGKMHMSQLVNMYNYYMLFMSNAMLISGAWQNLKLSQGACTTIAKIMDTEGENLEEGLPVPDEEEDIKFENVSFSYDGKRKILDNVSFKIPKGKVTAIVGENGCGKSTCIKLLERFTEPQEGTVRLGDSKLCDVNLTQWRNAVGYLFQGEQMIKGSIAENIKYGIEGDCSEEEMIAAAKLANAYDFIMQKEDGFNSQVSRFDPKCSGGEMQRIAIARIILKKPQYLIMDEATSGIDVIYAKEVLGALNNMMQGKTVIMVSHDMDMIKKADNIVVINKGRVEAAGDFETVSANSPLFKTFLS